MREKISTIGFSLTRVNSRTVRPRQAASNKAVMSAMGKPEPEYFVYIFRRIFT